MTAALEGGEWSAARPGRTLPPGKPSNVTVQNIFHGRNNITCGTQCKYTTAATLYTLETWFVSGT